MLTDVESRNADGTGVYFVSDEDTEFMRLRYLDLPVGLAGGLEFSPDGGRIGLVLNTPQTPSDVFTLDLDTERPHPLDLQRGRRAGYRETLLSSEVRC